MKLNTKHSSKRKAGMTLLELTVVILVLLSLISILFVGARAWKKGSDRSANIMNIRNCQQAMRGHQNMRQLNPGAAFTATELAEYMQYPSAIGTAVTYTDKGEITPESAADVDGAITSAHLWLIPGGDGGGYTGDYGFNELSDTAGW